MSRCEIWLYIPTASDSAIGNRSHGDVQPHLTSMSVILRLYNSSTARLCKSFRNKNRVSLKALFCAELFYSATDSNLKLTV